MQEEWRPIVGYEDLYEISSLGRVRSLDRYTYGKNGSKRLHKGRYLKPFTTHGYKVIDLYKDKKRKHCKVHRLVAEAFILNDDPENKTDVNHIDGDKSNNAINNLEWCTRRENIMHAFEKGLNTPINLIDWR